MVETFLTVATSVAKAEEAHLAMTCLCPNHLPFASGK